MGPPLLGPPRGGVLGLHPLLAGPQEGGFWGCIPWGAHEGAFWGCIPCWGGPRRGHSGVAPPAGGPTRGHSGPASPGSSELARDCWGAAPSPQRCLVISLGGQEIQGGAELPVGMELRLSAPGGGSRLL